jgi:hypothetical protein
MTDPRQNTAATKHIKQDSKPSSTESTQEALPKKPYIKPLIQELASIAALTNMSTMPSGTSSPGS